MIFSAFILKCFIQLPCTNLNGSQKEGGDIFSLLRKLERGGRGTQKEGEGFLQKSREGRGGFQPWRKL